MGKNLLAKVTQNFSGKFGVFGQKSFARPQIWLLLHLCPGIGQKYVCRGGPKVAKLYFHHSKLRKQLFLQKIWWDWWALLYDTHTPKTFYNKKVDKNNKNIFTNKHIMNFENNSHWYFFFLIIEPDTKFAEHKHTLSAHHRLIIIDTERFVTALVVGL